MPKDTKNQILKLIENVSPMDELESNHINDAIQ